MIAHFEKITDQNGECSFYCRRFDSPTFTTPWHFHPEWELTLIIESRGQRFVGDSIAAFAPGGPRATRPEPAPLLAESFS